MPLATTHAPRGVFRLASTSFAERCLIQARGSHPLSRIELESSRVADRCLRRICSQQLIRLKGVVGVGLRRVACTSTYANAAALASGAVLASLGSRASRASVPSGHTQLPQRSHCCLGSDFKRSSQHSPKSVLQRLCYSFLASLMKCCDRCGSHVARYAYIRCKMRTEYMERASPRALVLE